MTPFLNISDQKILVTGATGFVGPHLYRRLYNIGADVHAVSRKVHSGNKDRLQWWDGDLTDINTVRHILKSIKPDLIFHLAGLAMGGRDLELVLPTYQSNLTTTVNMLTAATEIGCRRIIVPGSLEEPGMGTQEIIPSSPYAAGKWACSAYAKMFHQLYNTPVVNLRLFMTYGPGKQDIRKLIPYVIISLLEGRTPKLGSGQRSIDWVYIDDAVEGLISAAQAPNVEGRTIDIGSGELVSIRSIVQHIFNIIDSGNSPSFGAIEDRPMEQVRVADTENTHAMIGWKAKTPLEKGLKETVAWYREQIKETEEKKCCKTTQSADMR